MKKLWQSCRKAAPFLTTSPSTSEKREIRARREGRPSDCPPIDMEALARFVKAHASMKDFEVAMRRFGEVAVSSGDAFAAFGKAATPLESK